ncbi:MAG: hypothetical protein RL199_1734 [Pseudomonadota bacterium]
MKAWQRLSLESDSTVAGCRWGSTLDADGGRGAVVRSFAESGDRRLERTLRLSWWRWWLVRRRLEAVEPESLVPEDAWEDGLDTLSVEWMVDGRVFVVESPVPLRHGPLARLVALLSEVGDCGGLMDALDGGPLPAGAVRVRTP